MKNQDGILRLLCFIFALTFVSGASSYAEDRASERFQFGPYQIPPARAGWKTALTFPSEVVQGFPVIVGLTVTNSAEYRRSVRVFDLARAGGDREISYYFVGTESDAYDFNRTGTTTLYPVGMNRRYENDTIWLEPGESISQWFDVVQTIAEPEGMQEWSLEGPVDLGSLFKEGSWSVLIHNGFQGVSFGPSEVSVRKPNEAETRFLRDLKELGNEAPWFPEIILSAEALPAVDDLPPGTRILVDFVHFLRAANKSKINKTTAPAAQSWRDWGHLENLINQLRYECRPSGLDEIGGSIHTGLSAGDARRIDEGMGLLTALRSFGEDWQ